MAGLSKEEMINEICIFSSEEAKVIAHEEFTRFEEENPNELVGPEIRELMIERATSELVMHLNNFSLANLELDKEAFQTRLKEWFLQNECADVRKVCQSSAREYIKKHAKPGDENLTFTDKFLRKVRENRNNGNVSSLLKDLDVNK